jgi:transposase
MGDLPGQGVFEFVGIAPRKKGTPIPQEAQDDVVRLYREGLSYREIHARTGCLPTTIPEILRRYNVEVRDSCKLTDEQKNEIARRYAAGDGTQKLSKEFRTSYEKIVLTLEQRGISLRSKSEAFRTRTLDETAFDTISEQSAYWTGMLMADGAILEYKYSTVIKLALATADGGHVEAFRSFLGSDHAITIDKPRRSNWNLNSTGLMAFSVSSRRLAAALTRFGVVPRKSKTAKVIGLEDNRDFWRGAVDGDGWISSHRSRPVIGLSGSWNLVNQFRDFFLAHFPECKYSVHPNSTVWKFEVNGTQAQRMIELLYANCTIALPRKWEIARRWLSGPFVSSTQGAFRDLTREDLEAMHSKHGACHGAWAAVARELGIRHSHLNKIMLRLGMKLGTRPSHRN